MRKNFTYKLLTAFALATTWVQADKITLKGGKIIEGEVVSETETEYVISVAYSKSIRTRKTFPKSEIVHIEKEAPDLQPYQELQKILPTPDQLSPAAYDQLIEDKVKPFLISFPNSQYAPEIKKMLSTLEGELARAKAGDVKLEGEWIAAAEWNANALELDGQLLVTKMRAIAARRSYRQALLIYDKINSDFRSTDAAADAAKIAASFLPIYAAQIKQLADDAPGKIAKREKTLQAMAVRDASRVEKAYADIEAKHQADVAAAKESKTKWLPVNEMDTKNLKTLEANLNAEINTIQRQASRSAKGASSGQIYREGWEAASKGNKGDVTRALANLRSRRIDNKYLQLINDQLAANPAPEEDTGPSAEELKAAADAKAAAEAKAKAEEEKKAEEAAKRERQRKAQEDADAAANAEPEEESSSILPIIIAIALLGILIAFLIYKRKQSEE